MTRDELYTYQCINKACNALFQKPQSYCRVCLSDVKKKNEVEMMIKAQAERKTT